MSSHRWGVDADPSIDDLRASIKELGPEGKRWNKALGKQNKTSSEVVAREGRSIALAMGGMQAKAASRIQGSATAKGLQIRVSRTAAHGEALAAFWGSKRRTGWYALIDSPDGAAQFRPWVGNTWKVGVRGEGPYAVNEAIATKRDEVVLNWAQGIDELARAAGFN